MKAKYTKGPWELFGNYRVVSQGNLGIAEIFKSDFGHDEEAEANARLIAAAPDLLEVLKEVMSWEENAQMTWAPAACAAINKAEGAES